MIELFESIINNKTILVIGTYYCVPITIAVIVLFFLKTSRDERGRAIIGKASIISTIAFIILVNVFAKLSMRTPMDFYSILNAMLTEPSVRRLKKHLPEHLFPKHFMLKAGQVNDAAGYELIHDISRNTIVKAYVFNETCRKQPFGAWGSLYIMDHPTKGWTANSARTVRLF